MLPTFVNMTEQGERAQPFQRNVDPMFKTAWLPGDATISERDEASEGDRTIASEGERNDATEGEHANNESSEEPSTELELPSNPVDQPTNDGGGVEADRSTRTRSGRVSFPL